MVARGGHGTIPATSEPYWRMTAIYGLRLVAMRCAARRRQAVVGDHDIDLQAKARQHTNNNKPTTERRPIPALEEA
jgi:hypothetical protein